MVDSQHFNIVTELCEPGDLRKYLKGLNGKNLDKPTVLKIFTQVLLALEQMHALRTFHKKLRLDHVLLTSTDHDIKVCSLGSSRMMAN